MHALKTRSGTIKEAQADKEKTRLVRQELSNFRTAMDEQTSKEVEDKIAQKMQRLQEKQNRKKEKKSGRQPNCTATKST